MWYQKVIWRINQLSYEEVLDSETQQKDYILPWNDTDDPSYSDDADIESNQSDSDDDTENDTDTDVQPYADDEDIESDQRDSDEDNIDRECNQIDSVCFDNVSESDLQEKPAELRRSARLRNSTKRSYATLENDTDDTSSSDDAVIESNQSDCDSDDDNCSEFNKSNSDDGALSDDDLDLEDNPVKVRRCARFRTSRKRSCADLQKSDHELSPPLKKRRLRRKFDIDEDESMLDSE